MKSIEDYLKKNTGKKMLVIFPHPDDETVMTGSLISESIRLGWQVKVVSLTEGDRGRVHIHGRGRSVAQMRRGEFIRAMKILNVSDFEMWKEDDGKLRRSDLWRVRVQRLIDLYDPSIVVTYDLSGVTGHPDHIELGMEVLRLKRERGFQLWWPVPVGIIAKKFSNLKVKKYSQKAELHLLTSFSVSLVKWRAIYQHLSQGMNKEFRWPYWFNAFVEREERYSVAKNKKYKYKRIKFNI